MFSSLQVRNVQEAYIRGIRLVRELGQIEETRNGAALVVPHPVMTVYERPLERVLVDPLRDANPFFHLLESMWMLSGRNDVASLAPFNAGLKRYSDDGETYHGAYGFRWRHQFQKQHPLCGDPMGDIDQLARVIELLRANPADRRVVLTMWDPSNDLGQEGLDFPCNTQIYFRARHFVAGQYSLDMMVNCRSNDAVWGAYGANAVHFSVLQEFVAAACGMYVGRLYQNSFNLHAYTDALEKVGDPEHPPSGGWMGSFRQSTYASGQTPTTPLFHVNTSIPVEEILRQVEAFWDGSDSVGSPDDRRHFFTSAGIQTLIMVRAAYLAFKRKDRDGARSCAADIPGGDWRRACSDWLERRYAGAAAPSPAE